MGRSSPWYWLAKNLYDSLVYDCRSNIQINDAVGQNHREEINRNNQWLLIAFNFGYIFVLHC